ncbi:neurogenic locus notch homolog protein 1-like isoform X2 [Pecten maximus]|uniref:neurogenic locus notch homolog protein 1-like isoform X2 n=1 Tax=Pecten maximus TaxID=6579 RepID=UPI0014587DB0|nr:neurogenic locus notch homolog protein 1-like isoform X2 [Pecten maximus]
MATRGILPVFLALGCILVCRAVMTTSGQCTKSCMNGGYCVWSDSTTYCACPVQYYGDACELMCNTTKCVGGRCIMYMNTSQCLCPGDYIGPMCYDSCAETYCQNNGNCSTDMDGKLVCSCMDGFSGSRCEINNTNIISCTGTSCSTIGTANCTQESGGPMCHCASDITGTYCERRNCLNTGLFNCSSNGVCNFNGNSVDSSTCSCMAGYNGSSCTQNIDDCVGVTCENGGTCVDGIVSFNCSCPALYTGTYCEKADCVARNCPSLSGNGFCDTDCRYEECGYDGLDCSLGVDPWVSCNVVPTSRGRHCSVLFMDGVCDQDCNTYDCLYDGFDCSSNGTTLSDCFNSSHCYESIGNGVCAAECDNLACAYGGHDCANTATQNTDTLILTFTPMNDTYGRLAEARFMGYQLSRKLKTRVYIRQNNGTEKMVYRVANSNTADIRAYFDIQQPSDCTMPNSCVTDVQTAEKMIGALMWMYSPTPGAASLSFRNITTCQEGYQFINGSCGTLCNVGCKSVCAMETGSCVDCNDGYVGNTCDVQCSPNCAGTCNSTQCIGGCKVGYVGDNCDQACSTGKYGADCNMTCADCANDDCDNMNGVCAQGCKNAGRMGTYCTENCASGTYGRNCAMTCSSNCLNQMCNRESGYCTGPCPTDKWGNTCDQDCSQTTCTTNCGACTTTTTTTATTPSPADNSEKAVIAGIIIVVILIVVALIIAYVLWRRSQAGVYDLDEKKGDEMPLNADHIESGTGPHEVAVVSETTLQTSHVSETKPLIEDGMKPEPDSERKEPEDRENSAEQDDPDEPMRESREMKTASKYLPPTEKEGGPGGVYVGPKGPTLDDVEVDQESSDVQQVSDDANFPVTPEELVAPPPVQQDTEADLPTPPSPPPQTDTPPSPKSDTPPSPISDTPPSPKSDTPASPISDTPPSPKSETPPSPPSSPPPM